MNAMTEKTRQDCLVNIKELEAWLGQHASKPYQTAQQKQQYRDRQTSLMMWREKLALINNSAFA